MQRRSNEFGPARSSFVAVIIKVAAALLLAPTMAGPLAAADADSVKGLVADNCSRCHLVPPYSKSGLESLNAPPFKEMANRPDLYTVERLRNFLQKPHYPMEPVILSARDIENLIAFIQGMRGR